MLHFLKSFCKLDLFFLFPMLFFVFLFVILSCHICFDSIVLFAQFLLYILYAQLLFSETCYSYIYFSQFPLDFTVTLNIRYIVGSYYSVSIFFLQLQVDVVDICGELVIFLLCLFYDLQHVFNVAIVVFLINIFCRKNSIT